MDDDDDDDEVVEKGARTIADDDEDDEPAPPSTISKPVTALSPISSPSAEPAARSTETPASVAVRSRASAAPSPPS